MNKVLSLYEDIERMIGLPYREELHAVLDTCSNKEELLAGLAEHDWVRLRSGQADELHGQLSQGLEQQGDDPNTAQSRATEYVLAHIINAGAEYNDEADTDNEPTPELPDEDRIAHITTKEGSSVPVAIEPYMLIGKHTIETTQGGGGCVLIEDGEVVKDYEAMGTPDNGWI